MFAALAALTFLSVVYGDSESFAVGAELPPTSRLRTAHSCGVK